MLCGAHTGGVHADVHDRRVDLGVGHEVRQGAVEQLAQHDIRDCTDRQVAHVDLALLLVGLRAAAHDGLQARGGARACQIACMHACMQACMLEGERMQ